MTITTIFAKLTLLLAVVTLLVGFLQWNRTLQGQVQLLQSRGQKEEGRNLRLQIVVNDQAVEEQDGSTTTFTGTLIEVEEEDLDSEPSSYLYSQIVSDDYQVPTTAMTNESYPPQVCMMVEDGTAADDQPVILGACTSTTSTDSESKSTASDSSAAVAAEGWRMDNRGMIHTQLDDTYCLQVGRKSNKVPRDGNIARINPCDTASTNTDYDQIQKFVVVLGGGIRPFFNQSLCLVWMGAEPDVGIDPILLKTCSAVVDRLRWTNKLFPIT